MQPLQHSSRTVWKMQCYLPQYTPSMHRHQNRPTSHFGRSRPSHNASPGGSNCVHGANHIMHAACCAMHNAGGGRSSSPVPATAAEAELHPADTLSLHGGFCPPALPHCRYPLQQQHQQQHQNSNTFMQKVHSAHHARSGQQSAHQHGADTFPARRTTGSGSSSRSLNGYAKALVAAGFVLGLGTGVYLDAEVNLAPNQVCGVTGLNTLGMVALWPCSLSKTVCQFAC